MGRAAAGRMQAHRTRALVTVTTVTAFVSLLAPTGVMQSNQPAERFTAFAVSLGGNARRSGAGIVEIVVDRWSTDAERQRLVETLQTKGPGEMLEAMRDMREVGHIRTPDSLGYPLRYAHQTAGEEGGRRIVIATDRPISFWEQVNRPRTIDYPFTVIQMQIGQDGTGEGRMSVATRIIAHDNIIELERYEAQPVMLNKVRAQPK
jgi:hypothetical protein